MVNKKSNLAEDQNSEKKIFVLDQDYSTFSPHELLILHFLLTFPGGGLYYCAINMKRLEVRWK